VACRPAFEKAAFSGRVALPASLAIAAPIIGLNPMPPNRAAAPAPVAAARIRLRRDCDSRFALSVIFSSGIVAFPATLLATPPT
jgi:hypothetical protein